MAIAKAVGVHETQLFLDPDLKLTPTPTEALEVLRQAIEHKQSVSADPLAEKLARLSDRDRKTVEMTVDQLLGASMPSNSKQIK